MSWLISHFFQFQVEQFLNSAIQRGTLIVTRPCEPSSPPSPASSSGTIPDNHNDNPVSATPGGRPLVRLENDTLPTPHHQGVSGDSENDEGVCKVEKTVFGEEPSVAKKAGRPVATFHLKDASSFYARVLTQSDIGFAEAYIAGDLTVTSCEELLNVFRVLILNRDEGNGELSTGRMLLTRIGSTLNKGLHLLNRNTLDGSKRNIQAHYDLSNDMFATFLGNSWLYSCALFSHDQEVTLDEAQQRKVDAVLDKSCLQPGMSVLDIGCGWGELAIAVIRRFPTCKVTGITLSEQQFTLARQRAEQAGIRVKKLSTTTTRNPTDDSESNSGEGRNDDGDDDNWQIDFVMMDYRDLAASGATFDRIVSVEMIEAVGHEFLGTYFASIDTLLNTDGLAVIQAITTPDARYDVYRSTTDFIQKHIFPGGLCPSLNVISNALAAHTQLIVEHVENIGPHYATTLAEWRRRFLQSVDAGTVAKAGFDDIFVRKWLYYLCYCESGFATRTLGVLHIVLTRVNNIAALGGPPACAQ